MCAQREVRGNDQVKTRAMLLEGSKPVVRVRTVGLISIVLMALCSGWWFSPKRVLLRKLRGWMRRIVSEEDVQVRNLQDEAAAMAITRAVKAASAAAAQVARLNQVTLTVLLEGKHQTKDFVSALQAVSSKFNKAELITRVFVGRTKELSAINAMPLGWHLGDKRYTSQCNALFSKTNCLPNTGAGNPVETPQPSKENSAFRSPSFLEVLAMLERGETPPGIKKINDKPPIPNQLPSVSCLKPKPKPWEMGDRASSNMMKFRT